MQNENLQINKINWEILALMRFLLAFIVMAGHLKEYTNTIGFLNVYTYLGSFEAILGFLLISGLSIGNSIRKNQTNYFFRRMQRIYPIYIASIVFQLVVNYTHLSSTDLITILINVFFLNHIVTNTSFVGPAWTLATEVWLYSLAPFFLKLKYKILILIAFGSFVSYLLYTCGRSLFHWDYYSGTKYGVNLFFLSFIWIAGFLLAIYSDRKKLLARIIAFIFFTHISVTVIIQVLHRFKHHQLMALINEGDVFNFIGITVCLAAVYYVVIHNERIQIAKSLRPVFNILGNISYPLYLIHCTFFLLCNKNGISNAFLMILLVLILSYLFYYVFDFYSKKRDKKINLA